MLILRLAAHVGEGLVDIINVFYLQKIPLQIRWIQNAFLALVSSCHLI